jgi:signal transduction histidine kinase
MKNFRLLYQIILAIVGIVFLTSIVLFVYSLHVQRELIRTQLDRKGQVLSRVLSRSVMDPLLRHDYYTIKLLFDPVNTDADVVSVALIGPDRYIKMHTDLSRLGEETEYEEAAVSRFGEQPVRTQEYRNGTLQIAFLSSVEIDNNRIGLIEVVLSDTNSVQRIVLFQRRMLTITGGVLLFAFIAAYLISRQITRPVIALTGEMLRFTRGSAAGPGEDPDKPANEIVILTETFQTMMDQIEESITARVRNEKMAVLGNLYTMLAHEVRNPLEPIKGSAELLKITYPDDAMIAKYTEIIQTEVSELIVFLDSFLDVARINTPAFERFHLNSAIRDVVVLLEFAAKKERIALTLNLDPQDPQVSGDIGMLKHVFLNTILNAIQAKSGDSGVISITTRSTDDHVYIEIHDNGVGIPQQMIERIFQPFVTTKADGSGIGLSTSRRIVEMHHGSIEISSEEGRWTRVGIRLPAEKE